MVSLIGLVLGVVVLIIGSFSGVSALPITMAASLIIAITNGMNVWDAFSSFYINGYVGAFTGNFLVLAFSCLYAKIMDETGASRTVGLKMVQWMGKKRVILVCIIIPGLMTYGGMSAFTCLFAIAPIMYTLFAEADLPRRMLPAIYTFGTSTFSLSCLPGTPRLPNFVPGRYFGTSLSAAPVMSCICAAAMFLLGWLYLEFVAKKCRQRGEHFSYPSNIDLSKFEITDFSKLPSTLSAFLPLVLLILICAFGGVVISNSTELAVIAFLICTVLCYALNYKFVKHISPKKLIGAGLGDVFAAIGGLAAVCGFGGVMQNSPAFNSLINMILSWDMSVYMKGVFATALIAGVVGSSAGSTNIIYSNLSDFFMASGANLNILHRLTVMASGTFDTLPHASANFLIFDKLEVSHKQGYWWIFVVSVAIPLIVTVAATLIVMAMGL